MSDEFDASSFVLYKGQKYAIEQSEDFGRWLTNLRDRVGRARILARLRRLADGNIGDVKSVGEGVYELRMFFGPGYRAYFMYVDDVLVLLLAGGDKGSQNRDIQQAIQLAERARDGSQDDTI
jgi:putative addiction module killer protein